MTDRAQIAAAARRWDPTPGFGMPWSEFWSRFGGATRTKNYRLSRTQPLPRTVALPPDTPEIPAEFIRLCPWEAEYVFAVARMARTGILETGRFNGGSLFTMACAIQHDIPLHSIDIAPRDDEMLRAFLAQKAPWARHDIIVGDSQFAKYDQIGKVDLLFVDGDHSFEGCLADLENWYDHLVPGGHLLIHDAYVGAHGVQEATLDFMSRHPELRVVRPPVMGPSYWLEPAGSVAHLLRQD